MKQHCNTTYKLSSVVEVRIAYLNEMLDNLSLYLTLNDLLKGEEYGLHEQRLVCVLEIFAHTFHKKLLLAYYCLLARLLSDTHV